jgi:hypothetical protein
VAAAAPAASVAPAAAVSAAGAGAGDGLLRSGSSSGLLLAAVRFMTRPEAGPACRPVRDTNSMTKHQDLAASSCDVPITHLLLVTLQC